MLVFVAGALLVPLLAIIVYSVALQRKAIGTQDGTVSKVDESLALGRDSAQRQKENLALVQELVTLHRETNRLLAVLAKDRKAE
jgi:hypothetical protein